MITFEQTRRIVERFPGRKILVVGDLMLDRYISGSVNRISPEAPVPVVRVTDEHSQPGGAANVALNIQSLGGEVVLAGITGQDEAAADLGSLLADGGICTAGVLASDAVRTTVKTRILAERQQVVRVDHECAAGVPADMEQNLCERVAELAADVAGIIIEDYGKGVVSQGVVDAVLAVAGKRGIPVGLDPKENHELAIAGVALATPNYSEALAAAGLIGPAATTDPESDDQLRRAAEVLQKKWQAGLLIITLGSRGMYMLPEGGPARVIPTKAREVFDVSGAGDTVIAAAMLAVVAGAGHLEAASLANCAAGVVVGKIGTATCGPDELLACVNAQGPE